MTQQSASEIVKTAGTLHGAHAKLPTVKPTAPSGMDSKANVLLNGSSGPEKTVTKSTNKTYTKPTMQKATTGVKPKLNTTPQSMGTGAGSPKLKNTTHGQQNIETKGKKPTTPSGMSHDPKVHPKLKEFAKGNGGTIAPSDTKVQAFGQKGEKVVSGKGALSGWKGKALAGAGIAAAGVGAGAMASGNKDESK